MIDITCSSSDRAEVGELQQSCSCTQVALHLLPRGRTGAAATGEGLPKCNYRHINLNTFLPYPIPYLLAFFIHFYIKIISVEKGE